jgi:hypothetical protein
MTLVLPLPITITLALRPEPQDLAALQHLREVYQMACARIHATALQTNTRDRSLLHARLYRQLCPSQPIPGGPPPLPAQYAVLAIGRAIHQLRVKARRQADPYPRRSLDVDSRVAEVDLVQGVLHLAHLGSYGLRGENAKHARLSLPLILDGLTAEDRQVLAGGHLRGGSLILPPPGRLHLVARFELPPPTPAAPDPIQPEL